MLGLNDKVFLRLRHDMTASNLLYIIALCGCYIIPQKKVTKEKATLLPLVSCASRQSGRLRNSAFSLRQSSPKTPTLAAMLGAAKGLKVKTR